MQTTYAGARTSEAVVLAASSGAGLLKSIGTSGSMIELGSTLGRAVVVVVAAAETLQFGVACNDYQNGRISHSQFLERTSGPAITLGCMGGGAVIGGIAGWAPSAGIGAVPGAIYGAKIGSLVAVPVTLVTDQYLHYKYAAFDEVQRTLVDAELQKQYSNPKEVIFGIGN